MHSDQTGPVIDGGNAPSGGAFPSSEFATGSEISTYEWIEAEILSGRLPPGSKIDLDSLARRRSIPPAELRGAIIRLSTDGLVLVD